MKKVAIIGGGAAGMLAGVYLGRGGCTVDLYDKNEKLGKKIYITGKGRCNVTSNCDVEDLFKAISTNPKFLYSTFYTYNNTDVIKFFEGAGVRLKVERGERVFPESDHSSDIIRALERELKKADVNIMLRTCVKRLMIDSDQVNGIVLEDGEERRYDAVLVATGGLSYPTTGSTGDGYRFAEEAGLKVTELAPSLIPMLTKEDYIPKMQGLSLKNTGLTIKQGKKTLYEDFGEMMFTHNGVTGPMILSASSRVGKKLEKGSLSAFLDFKPALSMEQLDKRVLREFDEGKNKSFKNVIGVLFPSSLTPIMIEQSGIDPDKKVHDISKEERTRFVELVKAFPFTIIGLGNIKEAIITRGGVHVKEINPTTMETKKVKNLYFAGEVLDLDAVTGGFNLQIAWSTGYMAAKAILES